MRILFIILFTILTITVNAQVFDNFFKYSTFYTSVNGGTSVSDKNEFSVNTGLLQKDIVQTPHDYTITVGVRKIQRFQYESKTSFKDGTESSFNDAATIGRLKNKFEYLIEADVRRQEGQSYFDQHHMLRYVADKMIVKGEYLENGFADIKYFEASERYKYNVTKTLSFNIGAAQRLSEPYGYDPLEEWILSNGNLHYTYLAIEEGYNVNVYANEYSDPSGNIVATSTEVWEAVIIPQVLANYVESERNKLPTQWAHSIVIGFDYYKYQKDVWMHAWGNILPYHYDDGNAYSYHKYEGKQWNDYSAGMIFGYKITKSLGAFVEGKYNKYWDREWYDFKFGVNYIIF
jgi:hypothetical protein